MMEYYCISSCSSSNKKQLHRLLRRCPTTTTDDDNDDDDGDALVAAASAAPSHASEKSEKISSSTEMLMRMAASVSAAAIASGGTPPCRRRRPARSSFGSCGGVWSVGDCPPTPSSPSVALWRAPPPPPPPPAAATTPSPPPTSSRIISCDAQGSHASREKEGEEEEIEERKMAANYGSFKKLLHPKKLQGAINPSLMHNKRRVNSCYANTAAAYNWDLESEGTYYTGSSGGGGSEYENLGSESSTRRRPGGSRRCRCFSARSIRSKVEAKLLAWKEARISKLMNNCRSSSTSTLPRSSAPRYRAAKVVRSEAPRRQGRPLRWHARVAPGRLHSEASLLADPRRSRVVAPRRPPRAKVVSSEATRVAPRRLNPRHSKADEAAPSSMPLLDVLQPRPPASLLANPATRVAPRHLDPRRRSSPISALPKHPPRGRDAIISGHKETLSRTTTCSTKCPNEAATP
uniref:Uncharacterized protein n=1 Tax=Ananas comosus var. bracteatus TaxID=296719 RepID=A0A6V7NKJ0_ANACO|nr:unnamed protein product [Ananas comosus var. bracteatus]